MTWWQSISPSFTVLAGICISVSALMREDRLFVLLGVLVAVSAAVIQGYWLLQMYRRRRHGPARPHEEP
ncbi:hypothetical protein [Nocardiopsis alborubida]|uniref:Uncharacterized protein n=1 Tax=Nocardiopsis alborubida TaxID=146802 RepID=A0A7X6RTQ1_9ACTN|nr:hypothetical protein [Nocardiopsis alborubida]NKZ01532.1 hypothetical protein [Nocardiopsis alborubida]